MSTTDTTYNGWTNRATWLVNLHLTNDQGLYDEVRELVAEAAAQPVPGHIADILGPNDAGYRRWTVGRAADALKDHVGCMVEDDVNTASTLLAADLLGQALADVDWTEVAEGLLDGGEAGSSSLTFLACSLLALVPVSLVVVFVARVAGAVAGVMA